MATTPKATTKSSPEPAPEPAISPTAEEGPETLAIDTSGPVMQINPFPVFVMEQGILGGKLARMSFVDAQAEVAGGTLRHMSGLIYKRLAPAPPPPPVLATLTVAPQSAFIATPYSANITGATTGSTLTLKAGSPLPAGVTLNSAARTISGTPTESGTFPYTLIETLAGATGSPKESANTIIVSP
ncbi:MAG: putative Ig domain-containing protein [Chitinophagaceae bacterium]